MFSLIKKFHRHVPAGIKRWYMPFVSRYSYRIQKNLNLIWPSVYLFEGLEKISLQPLTFAYAGFDIANAQAWGKAILTEGFQRRLLTRRWIREVPRFLRNRCPDCSMVFMEHNLLTLKLLPAKGFRIPFWVDISLDISRPMDKLFGNQRSFLKAKIRKNGLSYKMSVDPRDFDDFYYNMFMPYIQRRHGPLAVLAPYDELLKIFRKGELILVLRGPEVLSAGLVEFSQGQARFRRLGVRGANMEYVKQGAIGALYYFLALEIKQRGHTLLYLGGTSPLLSNGVTRFKSSIQGRVDMAGKYSCVWAVFLRNSTALKKFLWNNPFIFIDQNRMPCGAYFFEDQAKITPGATQEIAQSWGCEGLHQRCFESIEELCCEA